MASLGEVGGKSIDKKDPSENKNRPKKFFFGVFFDGTGNNMIQKDAAKEFRKQQKQQKKSDWETAINPNLNKYGANPLNSSPLKDDSDYSNVAILHSVYQGLSQGQLEKEKNQFDVYRYNIYVEGPGKSEINKDSNTQNVWNWKGSAMGTGGTGVTALVGKAVNMVKTRIKAFDLSNAEIHFHVVGFSRGAACARLFSYLVVRRSGESLNCENEFKDYFEGSKFLHFLDNITVKSKSVDFLGLFDTVSSIGMNYDNNVTDYGLFSPNDPNVKHTFHLCALDEFRDHFAITDIGMAASIGNNAEIYIPGCHSDVGGGYVTGTEAFALSYRGTSMFVTSPQNTNGQRLSIGPTGNALSVLGWFNESAEGNQLQLEESTGLALCRRRVLAGYSNIPLKMMAARAENDTGQSVFAMQAVGQARFNIPDSLSSLGQKMINFGKTAKGRKFYFPNNTYTYRNLRNRYIHFSSTDRYIDSITDFAMAPSRHMGAICRILYRGNRGNNTPLHICDYNL